MNLSSSGVWTLCIALAGPIATVIVGLIVAYIAWQQWRVARNKLRLDLFDRRYKVFDSTRKFVAEVIREATFPDSKLFEFYAGTSDAEFLFEPDVVDYIAQIRKRALNARVHQESYEPLPVGDKRTRLVKAEHAELSWLTDQITAMSEVFKPYLGFSNIR